MSIAKLSKCITKLLHGKSPRMKTNRSRRRRLFLEHFEQRALLAGLTVGTVSDLSDGDVTSIVSLMANRGSDDKISLREAIAAANNTGGANVIDFDSQVFATNQWIVLTDGLLTISSDMTIVGPRADLLTISGDNLSGVFQVNSGIVAISGVTLTGGNASYGGGGISNYGTLTITDSTLSGNSAEIGGGILSWGTLTLTSSTLSGNTASDYYIGGGGLAAFGLTHLNGNIIAGNFQGSIADDIFGLVSGSHNLIGTGGGGGLVNGVDGNQVGVSLANVGLAPLAYNGGPTQTMALLPGSYAIARGVTETAVTFDQRGVARPINSPSDVGAYQIEVATAVDTITTVTAANVTYNGSSYGAIAVVGPGAPAGTVAFLYSGTGITVYNSSDAPINAGSYHVVATFTPDDSSAYNSSSDETDFTIEKAISVTTTIGDATVTDSGDQINAGTYYVTAYYAGDANHTASTGSVVAIVINQATSTTTLTSNVSTSIFGQTVTFTATVTTPAGTPTGSVNFYDGINQIGSGNVIDGQATFATSTLNVSASHSITAIYVGDGNHLTSTSAALGQSVTAVTATSLQSAIDTLLASGSTTLTVPTTNSTQLTTLLSALNGLGAQSSPVNVVVALGANTYTTNISLKPPLGVNVTLAGNGTSSVVNGNVTVNQGGNGASATSVIGLTVNGNLNLGTGNGAGGSLTLSDTSVSGSASLQTGNGANATINVSGSTFTGGATLQTGNGPGTSINVSNSTLTGKVQVQTGNGANSAISLVGAIFTGSPTLQMGNGNGNLLTINDSTFQQAAQIQMGNGTGSALYIDATRFLGKFDLQTGNGGATIAIGTAINSVVTFDGPVTVKCGNGADTLRLGTGLGASVKFNSSASFDGKGGNDTKQVGNVLGTYTLNNF